MVICIDCEGLLDDREYEDLADVGPSVRTLLSLVWITIEGPFVGLEFGKLTVRRDIMVLSERRKDRRLPTVEFPMSGIELEVSAILARLAT